MGGACSSLPLSTCSILRCCCRLCGLFPRPDDFQSHCEGRCYEAMGCVWRLREALPIFKTLDEYALSRICDVLRRETHKKDEVIMEQGDPKGDKFYIVEEGQCVVKKAYIDGVAPRIVKEYGSGDCFGELALLRNEPRAATVIAASDCTVLVISRRSFKAMLGPLEDILKSNAAAY